MRDEETQILIDSLRGELREEKGVVEALEESKASAERMLSAEIQRRVSAQTERDSRLTKEAVSQWLRSEAAIQIVMGEHERFPYRLGRHTAISVLDALDAAFGDDQPSTGGDGS